MRSSTVEFLRSLLLVLLASPVAAQSPGRYCGGAAHPTMPSDLANAVGELSIEHHAASYGRHSLRCGYGYAAEKCGDHATAREIYDRCIADGHAGAMVWKAQMLESGLGIARDPAAAARLFRRAGETGTGGYATLGKLHYASALWQGHGVARDETEALRWFRAAAAEGDRDAAAFLAEGYHTAWRDAAGRGVGTAPKPFSLPADNPRQP
jgi:TPR repeat protein